ncbi:AraC-like DNA-binding protein [Celerinatantimonas diazotrophica]|uniref:AraC-like DNA-binding protein n=2 Tax=Celerinatantimonas diazotrophica TaxID=412034 RepID=A0A4R1J9Y8_9GAMM|nr:AraC-like DNA-binding protein [Celerinatantimonas diazotrophica]CAG9294936.1 HTH-type transcriptional regulator VirS [Celerinatantimonas diazotrophica]
MTDQMLITRPLIGAALRENICVNQGVLAAAASGLDQFISQYGADVDRVLGRSGINPEILTSPTQSLQLVNYCKVLEEAAKESQFDNFGLYYGRQFQPQSLGLIGYIGLCSANLAHALTNVANAFHWHQHDTFVQFVEQGECYRFDYQVRHGAIVCRRQDAELTMGMIFNLIRQCAGKNWAPREVHFEHPRPELWHEHCKVFDAPVYFEQPFNSLLIPKSDLKRAMPGHDPILLSVMTDALKRLNMQPPAQDVINQTRAHIQSALLDGEPDLDTIAEQLNLSRWSLQRRLRQENLSFSGLVDKVRQEVATHYLHQKQMPISEMGLMLGYSETSAFSRAFRRWFGMSPRQYRQNQNQPH